MRSRAKLVPSALVDRLLGNKAIIFFSSFHQNSSNLVGNIPKELQQNYNKNNFPIKNLASPSVFTVPKPKKNIFGTFGTLKPSFKVHFQNGL